MAAGGQLWVLLAHQRGTGGVFAGIHGGHVLGGQAAHRHPAGAEGAGEAGGAVRAEGAEAGVPEAAAEGGAVGHPVSYRRTAGAEILRFLCR